MSDDTSSTSQSHNVGDESTAANIEGSGRVSHEAPRLQVQGNVDARENLEILQEILPEHYLQSYSGGWSGHSGDVSYYYHSEPGTSSSQPSGSQLGQVKQEGDAEHPTTLLLQSSDSSADGFQSDEDNQPLIPSTVEIDESNKPLNYKENTAEAFNSFWKYKKFPKGPKVKQNFELKVVTPQDPHQQIVFTDPVFDKSQENTVRHFGKARIGEGNDITPNPEKLSQLGKQMESIGQRMSSLGDSTQDRKEKMKLSSRICRIKRSANHEANKIKFAGLEKEREELSKAITKLRDALSNRKPFARELAQEIYQTKVAGRTSEYVNTVLEENKLLQQARLEDDFDFSD